MKKLIILLIAGVLGLGAGYFGFSYIRMQTISSQEKHATTFMQERFSKFVKTWKQTDVAALFAGDVNLFSVVKVLQYIKDDLGSCELKTVAKCESLERYKTRRLDKHRTSSGYSVRCPFELSCEKTQKIKGESVFHPDNDKVELYVFTLDDPE